MAKILWYGLAAMSLLGCGGAAADVRDELNALRARGCEGRAGVKLPLHKSAGLDEVAKYWSRGGRLRDAIKRADYPLLTSSSMHVSGAQSEAALVMALTENYCEILMDPAFTEIGLYAAEREVWVVVASPATPLSPANAATVSNQVLTLINKARAQPRNCGSVSYGRAPTLTLNPRLARAALAHAKDMAQHDLFDHIGSDGSRPADRVLRTGYHWSAVGENIASGSAEVDRVVQGWLESPGHCGNIMSSQFKEMGIAFHVDRSSRSGIYWSQVFATPQ